MRGRCGGVGGGGAYKDQHHLHIYYCRDWHQSKAPKEKEDSVERGIHLKKCKMSVKVRALSNSPTEPGRRGGERERDR